MRTLGLKKQVKAYTAIEEKMKLDLKKLKMSKVISTTLKEKNDKRRYLIEGEESLRELFQNHRKKNKMTQQEIAIFSNLSRLAVNEFELGKSDIRLSTFFKLLKAYGFKLELRE